MKKFSFNGKNIWVTGASGGLESAMVKFLAEWKAWLAVTSRSEKALSELTQKLPRENDASSITADFKKPGKRCRNLPRGAMSAIIFMTIKTLFTK